MYHSKIGQVDGCRHSDDFTLSSDHCWYRDTHKNRRFIEGFLSTNKHVYFRANAANVNRRMIEVSPAGGGLRHGWMFVLFVHDMHMHVDALGKVNI